MRLFSAAVMTGVLLASQANAEPCCRDKKPKDLYVTLALAGTTLGGDNLPAEPSSIPHTSVDYDIGYRLSGALGYRLSPYFRIELEFATRNNEVSSTSLGGTAKRGEEFRQDSMGGSLNGYIDLPNRTLTTPYIGAGVGIYRLRSASESADSYAKRLLSITTEPTDNATDTVMGYQFMAGFSREMKLMGLRQPAEFVVGYRYFMTQDGEDRSKLIPTVKFGIEQSSHELEIGFRVNF